MKTVPRSRDGRSFAQPGTGHGFQGHDYRLSLDDSMHPTESISDMYGDDASSDGGSDYHHSRNNSASTIAGTQYTAPSTPPRTPDMRTSRLSTAMGSSGSPILGSPTIGSPTLGTPGSPTLRAPPNSPSLADAANHSFPLNDLDYESNPQAVQQELDNLQALRRMSMDVTSVANDPDLPTFNFVPSLAPKGVDSQDDASRLFWVPARLHPELAPKEFKTFVESRVQQIRGHGEDSLSVEGLQAGPSLRRKKSMLSRQIDNSEGKAADHYEDGAESLRRQRSNSSEVQLTVSDIENVISTDPSNLVKQLTLNSTERALMGEPGQLSDDMPIFPAAPPGQSLRRSTRTAYRGGSLRKGKRVAPSRRGTRGAAEIEDGNLPSPSEPDPDFKLSRVQTEPVPSISITEEDGKPVGRGRQGSGDRGLVGAYSVNDLRAAVSSQVQEELFESSATSTPPKISSERMVRTVSEPGRPPQRVEVPSFSHPSQYGQEGGPERGNADKNISSPLDRPQERPQTSNGVVSPPPAELVNQKLAKRPQLKRTSPIPSTANLQDVVTAVTGVQPIEKPPGVRRSDSSPGVTIPSAGKEGPRKSSWAWLMLGSEGDKDKDKDGKGKRIRRVKSSEKSLEKEREKEVAREKEEEKKREKEREKEKEKELREQEEISKRTHARLDLIPKSIEGAKVQRRESVDSTERPSMDQLEREREKEKDKASRKTTSHDLPKKESGIFSSIFGGSKKKSGEETTKKKSNSNLAVPADQEAKAVTPQTYYYTRFPIHIERAIYRLSHLKLANPRRPLLQQVLLSNFMYAYLAKVQQMQPQQTAQQKAQEQQRLAMQRRQEEQERQRQLEMERQEQYDGNMDQDDEDYDFDDDGQDDQNAYDNRQTTVHDRDRNAQRPPSRDSSQQQHQQNQQQQQQQQQQQHQQHQHYSQGNGRYARQNGYQQEHNGKNNQHYMQRQSSRGDNSDGGRGNGGPEYGPSSQSNQQRERQYRQKQQQLQQKEEQGYDDEMW